MDKEEGLQRDVKFGRVAIRRDHSSKGRSFHADGPTTKRTFAKKKDLITTSLLNGTTGQKLTPCSWMQHPMRCQNWHWTAEVAKVRGGLVKDTIGDHCSDIWYCTFPRYIPWLAMLRGHPEGYQSQHVQLTHSIGVLSSSRGCEFRSIFYLSPLPLLAEVDSNKISHWL